jgi:hypothetical protein
MKNNILGILFAVIIFSASYFLQKEVVALALTYLIGKEIIKNRG